MIPNLLLAKYIVQTTEETPVVSCQCRQRVTLSVLGAWGCEGIQGRMIGYPEAVNELLIRLQIGNAKQYFLHKLCQFSHTTKCLGQTLQDMYYTIKWHARLASPQSLLAAVGCCIAVLPHNQRHGCSKRGPSYGLHMPQNTNIKEWRTKGCIWETWEGFSSEHTYLQIPVTSGKTVQYARRYVDV